MKLWIASDHAGLNLKAELISAFTNIDWIDLGPNSKDSVDYPDYADKLCEKIDSQNSFDGALGVLICGSGQGMAIRANKYPFVRAALCWNSEIANLSRAHNNANILCLGARFLTKELAMEIVNTFIATGFEGGRHQIRVSKLNNPPRS